MTILLITLLAIAALAFAFAINAAHRSGYRGLLGFAMWLMQAASRESWSIFTALSWYQEGRVRGRQDWAQRHGMTAEAR